MEMTQADLARERGGGDDVVRRHRLSTRIWHWVNVLCFFVLLMSGLMIFNAHPRLYWGAYGANHDPAWLEIASSDGRGYLRIGEATIETTGVLGVQTIEGRLRSVAFPGWATIPSRYNLALARRWHLTFAWAFGAGIALYLAWSVANGHLRRDVLPNGRELAPTHLWREVRDHAALRFAGRGPQAYNVLQKLVYLAVILVLIPVMVLSGLTMSPAMDAAWPWLVDLFGGRQSARSIHFIAAWLLVAFLVVHLLMVLLVGPVAAILAMITGRARLAGD
jgi:thiosulfate reductase cytochrome b subunit